MVTAKHTKRRVLSTESSNSSSASFPLCATPDKRTHAKCSLYATPDKRTHAKCSLCAAPDKPTHAKCMIIIMPHPVSITHEDRIGTVYAGDGEYRLAGCAGAVSPDRAGTFLSALSRALIAGDAQLHTLTRDGRHPSKRAPSQIVRLCTHSSHCYRDIYGHDDTGGGSFADGVRCFHGDARCGERVGTKTSAL